MSGSLPGFSGLKGGELGVARAVISAAHFASLLHSVPCSGRPGDWPGNPGQLQEAFLFEVGHVGGQHGISGHESRRRLHYDSLFGAWLYEVGPDTMRIFWAQLLARHFSAGGLFNGQAVLNGNISSLEPICHCGLDDPYLVGESFLASSDGNCFV